MIHSLTIHNIAIIERLTVFFSPGLNVLSGETGAGKSIIVDAMNLVLGERADRELIRTGEKSARVEAVFYIDHRPIDDLYTQYGIQTAEELLISRELATDGRNTCRINGCLVNLSTLKEFMDRIVDLHGQHEHQHLLHSRTHIGFVDDYGGIAVESIRKNIRALFKEYKEVMENRESIGGSPQERAREADLLRYEIREIQDAAIRPGEEDELRDELNTILNAEKISDALLGCHAALYVRQGSVLEEMSRVAREMAGIAPYRAAYAALADRLWESYYNTEDIAHEAQRLAAQVYFDQDRAKEIEQRLDILCTLKRKYGGSEEAVCTYLSRAEERYAILENSNRLLQEIQNKLHVLEMELYALYIRLTDARSSVGAELERRIEAELKDLGMSAARFAVQMDTLPAFENTKFTESGPDRLEFVISTNVGEPLKPLAKIASGGEVSRIMLAFKNILADTDQVSTLIFDEIDAGISGQMAHIVAEKLSRIARGRQVICVTHLPQIAAMADSNYLIEKMQKNGKVLTVVHTLDTDGKILEVSRLSGGAETESSRLHAAEMIQKAAQFKCDNP